MRQTEDELVTLYDKWLYVLKNLSRLDRQPAALKEKVFTKLFEEAEIAKFSKTELKEYEDSLKAYRDVKNSIDTALERGREEGRTEGLAKGRAEGLEKGRQKGIEQRNVEIARKMLEAGMAVDVVMEMTGLSEDTVRRLR